MRNEEKYKEIKEYMERQIEEAEKEIVSWKVVGKNYKTRKDGKPLANIYQAFKGVDGIAYICRAQEWGTKRKYYGVCNTQGFTACLFCNHPTVADVEAAITQKIDRLKKEIDGYKNALNGLDAIIADCDLLAQKYFSIFPTNGKETLDEKFLRLSANTYLLNILEDWNFKRSEVNTQSSIWGKRFNNVFNSVAGKY